MYVCEECGIEGGTTRMTMTEDDTIPLCGECRAMLTDEVGLVVLAVLR